MVKAQIGDVMKVKVRHPHPQTFVLTLMTQAAADYATELLNDPNSGWWLERADQETVPAPEASFVEAFRRSPRRVDESGDACMAKVRQHFEQMQCGAPLDADGVDKCERLKGHTGVCGLDPV
jgi:hypothetical protein